MEESLSCREGNDERECQPEKRSESQSGYLSERNGQQRSEYMPENVSLSMPERCEDQEREWTDVMEKISSILRLSPVDIRTYSPLTLAYIGDGAYDLAVRTVLVNRGNCKPNKIHHHCSRLVKAGAQAKALDVLRDSGELTEEETVICRRGYNAKPATIAKNATVTDYRKATGFEALMGYLYLTGQIERMLVLIRRSLDILESPE